MRLLNPILITILATFVARISYSQSKMFEPVKCLPIDVTYGSSKPIITTNDSLLFLGYNNPKTASFEVFKTKNYDSLEFYSSYPLSSQDVNIKGFTILKNKCILLVHKKILIYQRDSNTGQQKLIESINTSMDKMKGISNNKIVFWRYYNFSDKDRQKICLEFCKFDNDTLTSLWKHEERYIDINLTHLVGDFLDVNSLGQVILSYPSRNSFKVFEENGVSKSFNLPIALNRMKNYSKLNKKLFENANLSLKEKIDSLITIESSRNRVLSAKFYNDDQIIIVTKHKGKSNDFVQLHSFKSSINKSKTFKLIESKTVRSTFDELDDNSNDFYCTPCLSCSNPLYIHNNRAFMFDIYCPTTYLNLTPKVMLQNTLQSYYEKEQMSPNYGLYIFNIK